MHGPTASMETFVTIALYKSTFTIPYHGENCCHGRPHIGVNGVNWPPSLEKMDEKLKSENMQKRAVSEYFESKARGHWPPNQNPADPPALLCTAGRKVDFGVFVCGRHQHQLCRRQRLSRHSKHAQQSVLSLGRFNNDYDNVTNRPKRLVSAQGGHTFCCCF